MTIRPATAADLPAMVQMGRRFVGDLYRGRLQDSPEQLQALGEQLLADPNSLMLVAETESAVVGMIAMMCYAHPMSRDPMAVELFWWVNPEQRGVGVRLLRQAERWASDRGARVLQMIAPVTNPDVAAFYERAGFEPVETTYQRSL